MRILALDTSSRSCSIAVVDQDRLLAEISGTTGRTHTEHLMKMIHTAMEMAAIDLSGIDGFCATKGPGSFTGIRIGLSTVKGLVFATGKPFVGISTLEALAMQVAGTADLICPMLDARRGEVYTAAYRLERGTLKTEIQPLVSAPEKVFGHLHKNCLFVGDGAQVYAETLKDALGPCAHFALPEQHILRGFTLARLAMAKFDQNHTDDITLFVPQYIRKSDAEMNLPR